MTYQSSPLWSLQDENGEPIVGGKIKFYEAGTSTPKVVYSDADRTTSAGSTLTVDANGNYDGLIYLDTSADYKVVITDASDNELYSFDNVSASGSTSSGVLRSSRSTCPLDYGAIGDGAADETAEVQSAINDATGVIDLAGKTYRCDSALALKSGIVLWNGVLDFSNCSATNCVTATGSVGTSLLLTSNASVQDLSIGMDSGDAATLSANDIIRLRTSQVWESAGGSLEGQWLTVDSVSGGTVTLREALLGDYETAQNAHVKLLTPVDNVTVRDVRFIFATQGSAQYGIKLINCRHVSILNCSFSGCTTWPIWFYECIDSIVDGAEMTSPSPSGGSAVVISNGCENVSVINCEISGMDYGVSCGIPLPGPGHVDRRIYISDNKMTGIRTNGVNVRSGVQDGIVSDNTITGLGNSSVGIFCEAPYVDIRRNKVRFFSNGINYQSAREIATPTGGAKLPPSKADSVTFMISENDIRQCNQSCIVIASVASSLDIDGIIVSGNTCVGSTVHGIAISAATSTADISNVTITGNNVNSTGQTGIALIAGTGQTITSSSISGNIISGITSSGYGVYISSEDSNGINNVSISDNAITDGNYGIYVDDASHVTISGNSVTDSQNTGILCTSTDSTNGATIFDISVDNNAINTASTYGIGIVASQNAIEDISVTGCSVRGEQSYGVYIADLGHHMNRVTVSDCMVYSSSDSGIGVYCASTSTLFLSGFLVSGCGVYGGDIGIKVQSCDGLVISGCSLNNQVLDSYGAGMYVFNCRNTSIVGNSTRLTEGEGILYEYSFGATSSEEGKSCVISGNTIHEPGTDGISFLSDNANGVFDSILIAGNSVNNPADMAFRITQGTGSDLTSLNITGNTSFVASTAVGLYIDCGGSCTLKDTLIANNVFHRDDDSANSISIVGGGAVTQMSMSGNVFFNGTNVVILNVTGSTSELRAVANQFFDWATATFVETSGTFEYKSTLDVSAGAGTDALPNMV